MGIPRQVGGCSKEPIGTRSQHWSQTKNQRTPKEFSTLLVWSYCFTFSQHCRWQCPSRACCGQVLPCWQQRRQTKALGCLEDRFPLVRCLVSEGRLNALMGSSIVSGRKQRTGLPRPPVATSLEQRKRTKGSNPLGTPQMVLETTQKHALRVLETKTPSCS